MESLKSGQVFHLKIPTKYWIGSDLSSQERHLPDTEVSIRIGDGSTDLWLYTSTKLKIVNCWLHPPRHKKQNFNFNNMKKLYITEIYFYPTNTDILKIFAKVVFCSVKCHFKELCLFETKRFFVKVVNNF
jgi:hypothetical protein